MNSGILYYISQAPVQGIRGDFSPIRQSQNIDELRAPSIQALSLNPPSNGIRRQTDESAGGTTSQILIPSENSRFL